MLRLGWGDGRIGVPIWKNIKLNFIKMFIYILFYENTCFTIKERSLNLVYERLYN